jgi:hypothetical protein
MVCACSPPATRLCDWRLGKGKGTCDEPLRDVCATEPAPRKDLCPRHAAIWAERQKQPQLPLLQDGSL